MDKELPLSFERSLYKAVIRFREEHPGVLEERTKRRKERSTECRKAELHDADQM